VKSGFGRGRLQTSHLLLSIGRIAGTARLLSKAPPLGSIAARLAAGLSSVGLSTRVSRGSEPVFSVFGKQYEGKSGISCHQILGAQEMVLALLLVEET
jgi:hypothetical protein